METEIRSPGSETCGEVYKPVRYPVDVCIYTYRLDPESQVEGEIGGFQTNAGELEKLLLRAWNAAVVFLLDDPRALLDLVRLCAVKDRRIYRIR